MLLLFGTICYIIIIFLSSIRSIETCYGCYKTESLHLFKGLPEFLFPFGWYFIIIFGILSELILSTLLGIVTRLIQPLLPNRQPHLPVAYPVSTDEALTTESQRDTCYISAGGNVGTHRVCPEALKVATLHYRSLG
jgi:hypothetical protein